MVTLTFSGSLRAAEPWVVYEGHDGPGKGEHIVLISGDEEYRSEEALPQLGRILARHHGFSCTVLFAVDPETGMIDPTVRDNIPGLEALRTADLMIIATRFRDLPDDQMKHIDAYVKAGKPILGMRTATHAFKIDEGKPYARYSFDSKAPGWEGGFGRRILGETWISHHGKHGTESSRGVIAPEGNDHPIVRGCEDIWGPTDVYTVRLPLPGDSRPLVMGRVLEGMKPTDKPVTGEKNDPMMPVAWIKTYEVGPGRAGRVFTTTMGAANDLESEGLRRLLVNATYWCLGMEERIPPRAEVAIVGQYHPLPFGFGDHRKGVKPADHAMAVASDAGEVPAGFVSLFNGRDLTGWIVPEGDGGHWKVVDGVIDYDARSEAAGDKNLWTQRKYGDFTLRLDWRIKPVDLPPQNIPYILPDGTHARAPDGKPFQIELATADSGIYLRGSSKSQVNIWSWPIGSGEVYGYRMDASMPPEVRAGVTPRTQADKPVGEWNRFEITMRGDRLTVVLNDIKVIDNARLPGVPEKGRIALQHHGGFADGKYRPSSSLVQFKNISIKDLSE